MFFISHLLYLLPACIARRHHTLLLHHPVRLLPGSILGIHLLLPVVLLIIVSSDVVLLPRFLWSHDVILREVFRMFFSVAPRGTLVPNIFPLLDFSFCLLSFLASNLLMLVTILLSSTASSLLLLLRFISSFIWILLLLLVCGHLGLFTLLSIGLFILFLQTPVLLLSALLSLRLLLLICFSFFLLLLVGSQCSLQVGR